MQNREKFRIISLVPSLTETLCHFGLIEDLVGCTSFCTEPKSLRRKVPSVGGTKDASIADILKLNPTHIVVNREENTQSLIAQLAELSQQSSFKLIETFIEKPEDNFALVEEFGRVFDFNDDSRAWTQEQRKLLAQIRALRPSFDTFKFVYFIWMNPWMAAGNQTYISRTLELIGGINAITTSSELRERYPAIESRDPRVSHANILLFSSEPFPFKLRHLEKFRQESDNSCPMIQVDGQALSWYGSRFSSTLSYLRSLHANIQQAIH